MKKFLLALLLFATPAFADGLIVPRYPVGQIQGTATNDNASAGKVGEFLSSSVPSSTTNLTNFQYVNSGATITLTPGDWDVSANAIFTVTATTSVTQWVCSISTVSATPNSTVGFMVQQNTAPVVPNSTNNNCLVGPVRFSVAVNTQLYLVVRSTFGASTQTAGGLLRARRVR